MLWLSTVISLPQATKVPGVYRTVALWPASG